MFLNKGKEYYPLEITQIISKKQNIIYDRNARRKPYVYIAFENTEKEGDL